MKTAQGLVKWAENAYASGWVYWYGTYCNHCTASRLAGKTRQYPTHYKDSRQDTYKKHIAQGKTCTDCVGLIKGYYWEKDGSIKYKRDGLPDTSASGMYRAAKTKGTIDSMPEVPGLLVWTKDKGHVGVYVGGGYVVEARGFSYGVQRNQLSKRGFTHWGYCPYIEYGPETATGAPAKKDEQEPAKPTGGATAGEFAWNPGAESNEEVYAMKTVKNGSMGTQVKVLQYLLNQQSYAAGKEDGIFGANTLAAVKAFQKAKGLTVDGIVGAKTWAALLK